MIRCSTAVSRSDVYIKTAPGFLSSRGGFVLVWHSAQNDACCLGTCIPPVSLSLLLITQSALSWRQSLTTRTHGAAVAEGGGRGIGVPVACQGKLFSHFILLAPYLFHCLSARLLGYVQTRGMCLRACFARNNCQKYTGRQLAVLRAAGGMFKPQSAGDCE